MTIDPKGHVGIGTVSPGAKLDIKADTKTTWASWFEAIRFSQDAHSAITHPGSGLLFGLQGGNDRRFYFGDARNKRYLMSLHADSGNLCIGTNPSGHMLDIASTEGGTNESAIRAKYPGGGQLTDTEFGALAHRDGEWKAVYAKAGTGNASGKAIALHTEGEVNMMNGNVGIGTREPFSSLQVGDRIGSFTPRVAIRATGSGQTPLRIQSSGIGTVFGAHKADGEEVFTIDKDGNVGIGTTEPGRKLSIETAAKGGVEGLDIKYGENGHSWGLGIMGSQNSNPNAFTIEHLDTDGNYHTKFLVDPDGKVGIGTTKPGAKLQLERDMSNTNGGKILFLELHQLDQQSPTVQPVYPSIRFHHGWRYWHRIEARESGIHFKTGDLNSDAYSNIYARHLGIAGKENTVDQLGLHLANNLTLRGKDLLNLARFGTDGDYQILHKAQGALGRNTLAIHVDNNDAFGVYSSGWKPLMEVAGGSGDAFFAGNLQANEATFSKVMHGSKPVVGYLDDGTPINAKRLSGTLESHPIGAGGYYRLAEIDHGIANAFSNDRIRMIFPYVKTHRAIYRVSNTASSETINQISWDENRITLYGTGGKFYDSRTVLMLILYI